MNKYIFPIYRTLVPKILRTIILKKTLRKNILRYFSSLPSGQIDQEQKEVIEFLEANPVRIFPYHFYDNYSEDSVEVFKDGERKLHYVIQDGKRLYFKKRWGVKRIKRAYSTLAMEQDIESPHRYLTCSFTAGKDDVIADIGSAEGNFSLSVIEEVKKIYLFEHNREWSDALKATFAPWADKVEIINKYVSDHDDESHIRFDTFFKSHSDVNFLKIDVDGAESNVLTGCDTVLRDGRPFKIALCTYHKNHDEEEFTRLLKGYGFNVNASHGYMIHYYDKKIQPPYLRRGLIRAVR
ncbi:MAG: FkbM family methyltransferase [Deltaproteobacteria bacterium]|nr:FkbM family methyltransferase [Deltaproteobacteria bacterium]